jgi:flagellar motor protein MotB
VVYDEKRDPFLLTIIFNRGQLRFDEGQCKLRTDTQQAMRDSFDSIFTHVCETARSGYVQSITLEGHTDNGPFFPQQSICGVDATGCRPGNAQNDLCKSVGFANNVRLSAARAQNVFFEMRALLAKKPEIAECLDTKFVVAGRGPTDPENGASWEADQNAAQKEANRRVVIKVRAAPPPRETDGA